MRIGRWQVEWITDGRWYLDGGAMYGRVPRVLWERVSPADELNHVRLTCRPLVLRSDDTCILVDSGPGRSYDEKLTRQLGLGDTWDVLEGLRSVGLSTDNVHYVILTHLHFDHVGGCVRREENGALVPTFPNARHLIQRGEWSDAHADHLLLRRSYVAETFEPLAEAGLIDWLDGSGEVLPGIRVEVTGGHTAHHQTLTVSGGATTLLYPADLMPLIGHINPAWITGFDAYPLDSVTKKLQLLEKAEREGWFIVLNHDPDHACVKIVRDDAGRYTWSELSP